MNIVEIVILIIKHWIFKGFTKVECGSWRWSNPTVSGWRSWLKLGLSKTHKCVIFLKSIKIAS